MSEERGATGKYEPYPRPRVVPSPQHFSCQVVYDVGGDSSPASAPTPLPVRSGAEEQTLLSVNHSWMTHGSSYGLCLVDDTVVSIPNSKRVKCLLLGLRVSPCLRRGPARESDPSDEPRPSSPPWTVQRWGSLSLDGGSSRGGPPLWVPQSSRVSPQSTPPREGPSGLLAAHSSPSTRHLENPPMYPSPNPQ